MEFTATARRLEIFSAAATVILVVAYATTTLTVGLSSLESPQEPIGDPIFAILEVLIIVMMLAMVALMVSTMPSAACSTTTVWPGATRSRSRPWNGLRSP